MLYEVITTSSSGFVGVGGVPGQHRRLREGEGEGQRHDAEDLEVHPRIGGNRTPHHFVERREDEEEQPPAARQHHPAGLGEGKRRAEDEADRITSYNVCYTKLLRSLRRGGRHRARPS